MKNYLLLALAAVALLYAGCKKNDPDVDKPKVVAVTGVSLNTNAVALEVDDSVTLTATVAPANATNKGVEWSVADDAIATVKNGVVKAVAIGETTVTVTTVDGGFTASATITVAESIIKVTGVTLDKPSLELEIGDSDTLTATVAPDNATNKAVSWSSANDAIATVEDGVVTAVAAGETTVTVTTADGAFKATANVVVKAAPIKVTGVSLNTNAVALEVDDSVTLTATVAPANATNKSVEWSVADDAIATVKNGVVKAVAIGETTVTVTTVDGGFTASATITVAEGIIKVTGVTLDKPSLELEIGDSDTLTATVAPDDATNKAVSWSSANDAIATVEDGVVTAVAAGETTVTVTTADGAFKATANVVVKAAPIKVTGVSLDKTMVALEIGESVTVEATVTPETAVNKAVEWSIADTAVATISNGVVTGVAAGETTLTVTTVDGGHTATIPVKVITEKIPVTGINMTTGSNMEIYEGKQTVCSIDVLPANATDSSVKWSSSNESVATVIPIDGEGDKVVFIKGVSKGTAIITATTNDGGFEASCEVTVTTIEPTAITIDGKTECTIYTWHGKVLELDIATTPTNADPTQLNWQYDDPYSGFDVMQYSLSRDKLTLDVTYPGNFGGVTNGIIKAFSSDYKNMLAKVDVYCQTVAWLHEMKDGAITDDVWPLSNSTGSKAFQYDWGNAFKYNFVAYYNTNGSTANSAPSLYYADNYIPNSEYTLTSSDPSALKVTKEPDGKSWKLERLNTSDLTSVTLTYTCGRHTQTYTINLIP